MHRFFGVVRIDGTDYRVMTLMREDARSGRGNGIHAYEVTKIELLDGNSTGGYALNSELEGHSPNGVGTLNSELERYPLTKVIKDVGKTMEKDKKLLDESKIADESTDYNKGKDGKRSPENGYNPDSLIHRCYGAISIDGQEYRVKLTLKETSGNRKSKKAYSYEVTKIEVLDGQTTKPLSVSSRKSNTPNDSHGLNSEFEAHDLNGRSNVSDVFVSGTKLLNNLEKSYDGGKKILDESKIADESTDLYRDPDETEDISSDDAISPSPQQNSRERGSAFGLDDIWTDGSLGLDEMITRAAVRLSDKHRADKTMKMDAYRAIGGNLSDLRKAMSILMTYAMSRR